MTVFPFTSALLPLGQTHSNEQTAAAATLFQAFLQGSAVALTPYDTALFNVAKAIVSQGMQTDFPGWFTDEFTQSPLLAELYTQLETIAVCNEDTHYIWVLTDTDEPDSVCDEFAPAHLHVLVTALLTAYRQL